jgi:BolA protein
MNDHPVRTAIEQKLQTAFAPIYMEINDDSDRHASHAGHDGKGESHFIITIVSDKFVGQSQIERHRGVYAVLEEEMKGQVHALRLKTKTPTEMEQKQP